MTEYDKSTIGKILSDLEWIKGAIKALDEKVSANYVTKDRFEPVESRVSKLEEGNTWLIRLVGSLVVAAIVGGVLAIK